MYVSMYVEQEKMKMLNEMCHVKLTNFITLFESGLKCEWYYNARIVLLFVTLLKCVIFVRFGILEAGKKWIKFFKNKRKMCEKNCCRQKKWKGKRCQEIYMLSFKHILISFITMIFEKCLFEDRTHFPKTI